MKELLRAWYYEERKKLSSMSWRDRIRYIRQYYWLYISGIIGVIALIVFVIARLLRGSPEYWLYAGFANTRANVGNNSPIWKDFVEYSHYDPNEKEVEFNTALFFDYTRNRARGNTYYNSFVALADSGTMDLITMPVEQLSALGESGRLLDWELERCAPLLEKYRDRLVYYYPPEYMEDTEPVPVGIDVSDSLLVTKYGVYPESAALGIAYESTRLDAIAVFLEFILGK